MGFPIAKALVLLKLSFLCFCFSVFGEEIPLTDAPSPQHHHHHHHHHHAHPPSVAVPVHPPSHAPVHPPKPHSTPPAHPPVPSPPVHPHPPVHPPVPSPPVHPHPPVHPPVPSPPVHPHPPVQPPIPYHFPRSFVSVQGVVYCKSCKYAGVDTLIGASPVLGATIKLQCNNTKYPIEVEATTDKNGYFFLEAPKTITSYGAHKCKVWLVSSTNAPYGKPSDLHGGLSGAALRPEKPYVSNKLPFVLYTVGPFAFEPKCPHH